MLVAHQQEHLGCRIVKIDCDQPAAVILRDAFYRGMADYLQLGVESVEHLLQLRAQGIGLHITAVPEHAVCVPEKLDAPGVEDGAAPHAGDAGVGEGSKFRFLQEGMERIVVTLQGEGGVWQANPAMGKEHIVDLEQAGFAGQPLPQHRAAGVEHVAVAHPVILRHQFFLTGHVAVVVEEVHDLMIAEEKKHPASLLRRFLLQAVEKPEGFDHIVAAVEEIAHEHQVAASALPAALPIHQAVVLQQLQQIVILTVHVADGIDRIDILERKRLVAPYGSASNCHLVPVFQILDAAVAQQHITFSADGKAVPVRLSQRGGDGMNRLSALPGLQKTVICLFSKPGHFQLLIVRLYPQAVFPGKLKLALPLRWPGGQNGSFREQESEEQQDVKVGETHF